jgi:hypothetical protein
MTMNADPEFAPLNEIFEDVSFNFIRVQDILIMYWR